MPTLNKEALLQLVELAKRDPLAIYRAEDAYTMAKMIGMKIDGKNLCYGKKKKELEYVGFDNHFIPANKYVSPKVKIPTNEAQSNDVGFGITKFIIAVTELLTGKKMPKQVCGFPSSIYYAVEAEEITNKAISELEKYLHTIE